MNAETRSILRFWAVANAVYALVIAAIFISLVPWKWPTVNFAFLAFAGAHAAAGAGLGVRARWGWRLAMVVSLVGFAAGVAVVGGLIVSWAYLKGIWGELGHGASIASLMVASVGAQMLGLFPALQLRALLRRTVRGDMAAGSGWSRTVVGIVALPLLLALVLYGRTRLMPHAPIPETARAEATAVLRAALNGTRRPEAPALAGLPLGSGPLFVTVWHHGEPQLRVRGEGPDLAAAIADAADAIATHPGREAIDWKRRRGRIKVDRVTGWSPILSESAWVVALSVNHGLDGLWRRRADGTVGAVLLPDDLLKADGFGKAPLVPGIREMRIGLDAQRFLPEVAGEGGLQRFRTESWIEWKADVLAVHRGNTDLAEPGPEAWRKAAIAGGDFVLRQLKKNGQFHYQYYPLRNHHPKTRGYNIPRHAGTAYSLSLLDERTGSDRFRRGARRALEWLERNMPDGCHGPGNECPECGCVVMPRARHADLGSTALSAVAFWQYERASKDDRFREAAIRTTLFLRSMQRPDGSFWHLVSRDQGVVDARAYKMFASEEAALAYVLAYQVTGEDKYAEWAEAAMDHLTGPKYDFFLGRFIYGADHWTCIAAEEAWAAERLRKQQYLDFCVGYSRFIERIQFIDWAHNHDWNGHYGFTALMVPQAPAAAGFTEAIISTYRLSALHGAPDARIRRQAERAVDVLARDQLRADNSWMVRRPVTARGGIRRSLVESEVRIDFTQHAASALLRAEDLVDPRI